MSTLVLDIETIGENWQELDDVTKHSLNRWVDKTSRSDEDKLCLQKEIEANLGLSPLTGSLVTLGVYDLERKKGVVYYVADDKGEDFWESEYVYKRKSEKQILEIFWSGASEYSTFVTFNGRRFDIPFLLHRSVVQNVLPTVNLMEGRYPDQQTTCRHVDLMDELTFFGAMQRRPSLHLFCRAYGIKTPKSGFSGEDIKELYRTKKFQDIARYTTGDVVAITELYKKWQIYLAFEPVMGAPDL